jgi:hypothetical protein
LNDYSNEGFGVHSICPIDVGNSYKPKHFDKLRFLNAFNSPIDLYVILATSNTMTNEGFGVHSIAQ